MNADFVSQFNAVRTSGDPRIALGASLPVLLGVPTFVVDSFPAARLNITEAPTPVSEPTLLGHRCSLGGDARARTPARC